MQMLKFNYLLVLSKQENLSMKDKQHYMEVLNKVAMLHHQQEDVDVVANIMLLFRLSLLVRVLIN
jgi:spermidine synthase